MKPVWPRVISALDDSFLEVLLDRGGHTAIRLSRILIVTETMTGYAMIFTENAASHTLTQHRYSEVMELLCDEYPHACPQSDNPSLEDE